MGQDLYLVFGGEVRDPTGAEYIAPDKLDIRGVFTSYAAAYAEWQAVSFQYYDDAFMRYEIVPLRLAAQPRTPVAPQS